MKKVAIILITFVCLFAIVTIHDIIVLSVNQDDDVINKITENEFLLNSSLFTQKENNVVYTQRDDISFIGFEEKIRNEQLVVYTNKKGGAVRVLNLVSGFIWCSDIYEEEYIGNLNFANEVSSAFLMNYRDSKSRSKSVYANSNDVTLTETVTNKTIHYDVKMAKIGIEFSYDLTLKNNKLNVLLDYQSIKESENKITSMCFFPYLGSVYKTTIPGYFFIPSGNGALIRFDQEVTIAMEYTIPFYGDDANLGNNEGEVLSLPVYGIVQGVNQNGVFIEIKDGSEFAKFSYKPASIGQNFNMAYVDFKLRETYTMPIPGSDSITMVPEEFYKENLEIEYTFFANDDANYVGFAKNYQKELVDRNILKERVSNSRVSNSGVSNSYSSVSIHIEAFGRDYEKGLIFKNYYNMTTTEDILKINETLESNGVSNIFYTLRAFNKNGYSAQSAKNITFDKKLGKLKDLEELETYFYYNPVESYNSKKDYPRNSLVNVFNEENFFKISNNKYKFYTDVKTVEKYTKKALAKYDNIALDGIGYRLYGDKNNDFTRYEAKRLYTEMLEDRIVPMYNPNYYFLENTSKYLNMPLYHDRLRFVTDSVPFLNIVLKGYIDYYSPYLNFSSNSKLDALKCIEYGVYPAYLVSEKASHLLVDTLSSNYYATHFDSSKDVIIDEYKYINSALCQVIDAKIVNRIILEKGICKVDYSNGVTIIVNYTNGDYSYKGITVGSMGYVVI